MCNPEAFKKPVSEEAANAILSNMPVRIKLVEPQGDLARDVRDALLQAGVDPAELNMSL